MDNMIKKFNEELKYYFPESRLEAVLFEIPLSGSKGIDIRGDLNVMEFYKFLNFNKIWITEKAAEIFPCGKLERLQCPSAESRPGYFHKDCLYE